MRNMYVSQRNLNKVQLSSKSFLIQLIVFKNF